MWNESYEKNNYETILAKKKYLTYHILLINSFEHSTRHRFMQLTLLYLSLLLLTLMMVSIVI